MANRPAPALALREGDGAELERLGRSSSARAGLAQRARIVLLAADGKSNSEIAERVGVARQTVLTWRARYRDRGLAGLDDITKPGKPRQIDPRRIIAETLKPPPKTLGVTHWSTRLLGTRLKVGNSTIAKAWRAYGIQPWRGGAVRVSPAPQVEGEGGGVRGVFLEPRESGGGVGCVEEW